MDKTEFIAQLRKGLSCLPQEDIDERLNFYSEMIDDYVEEGLTETEAVKRIGSASEIAAQIVADASLSQPAPENCNAKKRPGATAIVLIILGCPIWLSLLIGAFAVVFSLYVSLWAIILSFWSVFGALASCAFAGTLGGTALSVCGNLIPGVAIIGASLVCGGLGIFSFYGCKAATKGTVLLTTKLALSIKSKFAKRRMHNA